MGILQRTYDELMVFPPAVLSILETRYLLTNCWYGVKNFISLLAREAFSSFGLKSSLSLFVRYQKLYANEADCKQ